MEYIEKQSEVKERARKTLFRMCIITGSVFSVLAVLNLIAWFLQSTGGAYGGLVFLFFLLPGLALFWAYTKRNAAGQSVFWAICGAGILMALSIVSFPSTLAQSPVAGLLVVGVFTLGLALFLSSLRFRD